MSDDPLYVLYGAPSCGACVDAANLLAEREAHHCKIGPALLTEAMAGAAAASASGAATIPQVFSCPCAELLAAEVIRLSIRVVTGGSSLSESLAVTVTRVIRAVRWRIRISSHHNELPPLRSPPRSFER